MEETIHQLIHEISINNPIYNILYGGTNKDILEEHTFMFNLRYKDEYDSDIEFIFDNIIAKIIEINLNINYQEYHRTQLGNYIHLNENKYLNPYITEEYKIENDSISDLEFYLEDLEIIEQEDYYIIKWTLPIYNIKEILKRVD